MDAHLRFHQLLKRDLLPLLRADGFKGSGSTYRRERGDRIDVLNIQGSSSGGRCCVNLAAHFAFLPIMGGGSLEPKKLKEYECAFRTRLREDTESDHWWTYGGTDAQAEASIASLVELYHRRRNSFWDRFEPFPQAFDSITPAQLDAGDLSNVPGGMTIVLASLTMARIMQHLGSHPRCQEFASVGLRHLGGAAMLKPELDRLASSGKDMG